MRPTAIDAGCAAGMALAVLHADEVCFSGVAPIIIRMASGEIVTIAGLGHWPMSMPADIFMREHGGEIPVGVLRTVVPVGVLRTVVPAAPDAWITALRDYGTMSFGDVSAAAIEYARDGFSVFHYLAAALENNAAGESHWPANAAIFMPDGRPPRLGERFVQTDLAATIQYMADEEKAAAHGGRKAGLEAARAAFYVGDIAEKIVAHMQSEGGYLTREDLANFRSQIGPAIQGRWRDFELFTCGPWCQGPTLIQSLLMIEKAGLGGLEQNSADYLHLLIEVIKCTFSDREYYYGDPDFIDVPLERLHSEANLDAWLKRIDPKRAMSDLPSPNGVNEPFQYPVTDGLPERDPDQRC